MELSDSFESLTEAEAMLGYIECDDSERTDYIESGDEGIDDFGFEETPASIREAETDRRSATFQQNYEALKDGRIPYETLKDQRDPTMVAYQESLRKPAIDVTPNRNNRPPIGCEHMGAHEMALKFPPKQCAYKDFRLSEGFVPRWGEGNFNKDRSVGSSNDPLQRAMDKRTPMGRGTPSRIQTGELVPPEVVYPNGIPAALSQLQKDALATSVEMMPSPNDRIRLLQLDAVSSLEAPWIKSRGGRTFVEMTIDSGAAATVVPRGAFDTQLVQTARTRSEVFATASGQRMPNYGEQRIRGVSTSGTLLNITAQVTDVKKPLISVQEMVNKGNQVIFKTDGPIIRNCKSGLEIPMVERGGQYLIELEIAAVSGDGSASSSSGPIFSRPEPLL